MVLSDRIVHIRMPRPIKFAIITGLVVALTIGVARLTNQMIASPTRAGNGTETADVKPLPPADANRHPRDSSALQVDSVNAAQPIQGHVRDHSVDEDFRNAPNLTRFIEAELANAEAGNSQSQFYISKAMEICETFFSIFSSNAAEFDQQFYPLARQYGAQYSTIESTRARCADFDKLPIEKYQDQGYWLMKSAIAGFPLAEAYYALSLGEERIQEARVFLKRALVSEDPMAMLVAGTATTALHGDQVGNSDPVQELAWIIAACHSGLDCTSEGHVREMYCLDDCQLTEDLLTYLFRTRYSETDVTKAESISSQLLSALRNRDWDQLGL